MSLRKNAFRRSALSMLAATGISAMASAQSRDRRPDGPPPSPPPVAFEACAKKAEGDACKVEFAGRSIDGICAKDRDERLFCLPEHPPEPPQR